MSSRVLAEAERASLNLILEDLRYLFDKEEILQDEIDDVLQNLKSEEVKTYIQNLRYGSKPETALRESFIAGKSILLKYLFGEAAPEVRSNGFLDYLVKDEMGRGIALELKPLFEAVVKLDKAGKPILERLKQKKLRPEDHRDQILKYIRKGEVQFVILTDLKDWFFYSKELTPRQFKHFCAIGFFDFVEEYDVIGNLRDYLERKEFESIRYELDKWFLESLKTWVKKLSETEFTVDEKTKLELIIGLVNKFIFVQTLDDYGVIEFNWIRKRWNYHEQMWQRKGKLMVLERFFDELDDWFFLYYDTELFRETILQYIKKDDENIDRLYRNLQLVFGLTYLQVPFRALKGVMQYNFRYIDEDVLGKAYEKFLADVRKEEGIYYTPKYITLYIAENTVGRVFAELLAKIKEKMGKEDFEDVKELVLRFTSIRVLDPACGSGSFLIKAIRIIVKNYRELNQVIENCVKKYSNYMSSLDLPQEIRAKLELLSEIREIVGPRNDRELIARILVRHIHGVDLDKRALEVAKVNIWLEAIKLSPKEFRYDKLPAYTNHILPNLEMNLCTGDSLFGLPHELSIEYLDENHQGDIAKLSDLRSTYMGNPMEPKLIETIESMKREIRKELDEELFRYLESSKIQIVNETRPFHWGLEFWYVFFNKSGNPLNEDSAGFDIVIGNPPYIDYRRVKPLSLHRFFKIAFESSKVPEKYNIYVLFMEKGLRLLSNGGKFGYINPVQWMGSLMALELRKLIFNKYDIQEIDDLSTIGVFEEPTLTNLGLFFIENHEPRESIKVGYKISREHIVKRTIPFTICRKSAMLIGDEKIMMLDPNTHVNQLIKKTDQEVKLLDIVRLEWGTSQSGYGKKKISVDAYKKLEFGKQQQYAPLIQTGDIVRHVILWKGEYIDKSIYSDKKKEQFGQPKIVFSRRAPRMECVYDSDGFYLGKVAFTAEMKRSFDHAFLLGVLNSSVIDFYFKKVYETLHPGGNLRFDIPYIHQLPVALPDEKARAIYAQQIKQAVERIIFLKRSHYGFLRVWNNWSIKLKTNELSLNQILINETKFMRQGEFSKTWTSKATFYPNIEQAVMNKKYKKFRLTGDSEKAILGIYGLGENSTDELAYEIEFKNGELMSHIYFSLLQALKSKAKIKTLHHLFTKTTIPIIKGVNKSSNELTPNIVRKVRDEFEGWLSQNKIGNIEADIVKIDNEIDDLEAKIDALVFKLYDLNEAETKIVLDSLKTPNICQTKILEFFRKL